MKKKATTKARQQGFIANARQARQVVRENPECFEWEDTCTKHRAKIKRNNDGRKWIVAGHSEKDEYSKGMAKAFWAFIAAGLTVFLLIAIATMAIGAV